MSKFDIPDARPAAGVVRAIASERGLAALA